jgi:hypothetical protein
MEDNRGIKRSHSHSKEGSPSPSSVPTPPPAPSGLPPPLGSPPEVSLCCPRSSMFEQGGPSEKVLVVDLSSSSNEEGLIPDTSRDEEFTRKLFGDLNCDVLSPPDDGNIIIILNDSDEEEEVHEGDAADTKAAPSSVVRSPTPTTSATDADEDPKGMQDDNSDGLALDRERGDDCSGGDKAGLP